MKKFHWPIGARTAGEPERLKRQQEVWMHRFHLNNVSKPSGGVTAFGALWAPACYAGCGKKKCKAKAFIFPHRKGGANQKMVV
jgi:hypothetical protein